MESRAQRAGLIDGMTHPDSFSEAIRRRLSAAMRRRRFALFDALISPLPCPLRILDVGGTQAFWKAMGFAGESGTEVVLLNHSETHSDGPPFSSVVGDARDLSRFDDGEFDVVFSNSVIEHVGSFSDQQRMAEEIRRVGQRYFVQTPNGRFPVEPHFIFPLFQFLPVATRVFLLRHFHLGWVPRIPDPREAEAKVRSIRLLSGEEVMRLFPGATIHRERFCGFTKSFVAYAGFDGGVLRTPV